MSKTMYMHTFKGRPASFKVDDGMGMLVWYGRVTLVASLRTLNRQQRRALNDARAAQYRDRAAYGYVRVEVPRV